jgi:hypothetical protein
MTAVKGHRKVSVRVAFETGGHWTVRVEGVSGIDQWSTVVAARHTTRDSAAMYAKKLRAALKGHS